MAPASRGQRYPTHLATRDKAQKTCQALTVRPRGQPAPGPVALRCASRRGLAPLGLRAPCHFDTIRGSGPSVLLGGMFGIRVKIGHKLIAEGFGVSKTTACTMTQVCVRS